MIAAQKNIYEIIERNQEDHGRSYDDSYMIEEIWEMIAAWNKNIYEIIVRM